MPTLGRNRPPIFARPWFAALSMLLGTSAIAFAGYTVEHPDAFTSKIVPATAAPLSTVRVGKSSCLPTQEQPNKTTVVLDEVTIMGTFRHRYVPKALAPQVDPCAPTWRSLATGPTTRQVREFCPTPGVTPAQHSRSVRPDTHADQHLTSPRAVHERVSGAEEPTHPGSLSDLLPPT
jgi:hypothetical protein